MAKQKNAATSSPKVQTVQLAKDMRIGPCSCKHEYQDSKYGRGKRAMNRCSEKVGFRCTVCGSAR